MNHRHHVLLPLAALIALLPAALARAADVPTAKQRTNVVVFVADDLGARDLGYAGSTFYESPNIDALAKRGCVFNAAYAAGPVCSPTRAALLTGRYPARVGITDWIGAPQPAEAEQSKRWNTKPLRPAAYREQLPLEEVTIGEVFRDAGYATMYAGKWHLGGPKFSPDKQGFDVSLGASHQGSPGKGGYFSPYNVPLSPGPDGEHLDLRLARESADWIAKQKLAEKPFLLYFALYDVHTPLMAPKETVAHFEKKRAQMMLNDEFGQEGESKVRLSQSHAVYAAMIKTMDDAVGIVIEQLESQGLMESTAIVFTSDNGGLSTSSGHPTSNAPLRAGKGWAYEGGVRVPQLAVIPGVTRPGSTCDVPTTSTDLLPTLAAACGVAAPKTAVDGISVLPALRGEALPPDRPLFWHYPHYGNQGGSPYSAIRAGNLKLIAFHNSAEGVELFDLAADPSEQRNLAADRPDEVRKLRAALDEWKRSVGAVDAAPPSPAASR